MATPIFEQDPAAPAGDHDRYRTLVEAIDQGFCEIEVLFDDHGRAIDYRFLEVNPRFVAATGLHDAVGRRMRELAPAHEEHWFELYGEIALTGVPKHFEQQAAALGRWYEVHAYRVGPAEARRVGVLFADITRRRQDEQVLRDADRRKDEFLATLAHELRNPLAPLRTSLDILQLTDDPATARELHAVMSRQVAQLTRLVDDLLEVSRITRGRVAMRMAPVDLVAVLGDAVEAARPLLDGSGQVLRTRLPTSPGPSLEVDGDAVRLAQVFTNLLNNAARYGRRGGQVQLNAWRDGGWAVVSVRDEGVGISAEHLRAIFDLFTQLHRERDGAQPGLGIGLSLVRSLVQRHGGEVQARSEGPGRGAEFVVRLPLRRGTAC